MSISKLLYYNASELDSNGDHGVNQLLINKKENEFITLSIDYFTLGRVDSAGVVVYETESYNNTKWSSSNDENTVTCISKK